MDFCLRFLGGGTMDKMLLVVGCPNRHIRLAHDFDPFKFAVKVDRASISADFIRSKK